MDDVNSIIVEIRSLDNREAGEIEYRLNSEHRVEPIMRGKVTENIYTAFGKLVWDKIFNILCDIITNFGENEDTDAIFLRDLKLDIQVEDRTYNELTLEYKEYAQMVSEAVQKKEELVVLCNKYKLSPYWNGVEMSEVIQ